MSLLISTLLVSLTIKVQAVGTTVFPFEDKCRMRPGLWSCTDCQKCTSFETCDVEEAIYRAGYSCHEWPYLNAVAPAENKLFLPVESKTITCANTTLSGCTVWDETKRSSTSLATTTCTCADYRSTGGNDYCHNWTCFGVGLTLCKQGTDCGAYQHYGQISYYQDCCYQTCESSSSNSGSSHRSGSGGSSTTTTSCIDHQDPKEFHYEFQECQCTDPQVGEQSTDGLTIYCANWQCVDYSSDDPAGSYIAHTGYFEYEKHNCKVRHVDGYCQLWNWQTDDYKQFQNTECTCAMTHFQNGTSGPKVCTQWDCTEKGAKKIEPNLLWSLFGLCFGGIFIVVLNVIKYGDNAASRYSVAFLFANLIVTVPLLLGGLGSLFFVLIIGAPLAFAQFWYSTFKGDSAIIRLNLGLPPGPNDRTKVAPDSGNTMASNTTGVEVMPQGIKVAPDLQPVQYAQVAQPVQYTQVAQPVQYAQIQGQPQYQQVGQMQNLYQQQMQQPQYQQQVQGQPQYQQSPQYQQMQGQPQYQQAPQYQQMQGQPQYQQAPQYEQMQGQPQYHQSPQYE